MTIDPIISGTAAAILLTLGAIFHYIWAAKLSSPSRRDEIAKQTGDGPDDESDCRLKEARELLKHERRVLRHNQIANTALTIAHIIVGGVLTSSFVVSIFEENELKKVTGILGLLVLLSSLIQKAFRPDVKEAGAKHRIIELEKLIRDTEDKLFERLKHGMPANSIESLLELRRGVSERIGAIRVEELNDLIPTQTDEKRTATEKGK